MWKRDEAPNPAAGAASEAAPGLDRRGPAKVPGERATIGRSITIRGEVTGDEDLVIQGRVDGSVNLKQHAVTVGPEGVVKADIIGRVVTVEGNVEGNLSAEEQVILRSSARVQGDISAPRVMLEDGSYFRGGVEMAESGAANRPASPMPASKPPEHGKPAPGTTDASGRTGSGAPGDGDKRSLADKDSIARATT